MKKSSLITLAFIIGLSTINLGGGKPLLATTLIWAPEALSKLIDEGLENNKELQSLEAKVEGLKEEISVAGSLENPRLGIGILNLPTDTFNFDQEPMTQKQIFIAQKIPWFGKRDLRAKKQAFVAERHQAILDAKRLELARKIATAYYDLGFIASSIEINKHLMEMMQQLIKVVETRYALGKGFQQDVLQAQVEISKLLIEKITLQKKYRVLEDRLNTLLNRERFSPIIPPKPPKTGSDLILKLDVDLLRDLGLNQNPWLKVRQAEMAHAATGLQLALKDYYPDMNFKVAYGQREKNSMGVEWADFLSVSMVVDLPIWHKKREGKKLEASKKSHEAVIKAYRNLIETLPYKVDALVSEIHSIQENYRLFSGALMLQTDQWARSSLAAYVVGKVEFNTMINAQIRLWRFELQTKQLFFNLYKKRAELEELIGGPLKFPPVFEK